MSTKSASTGSRTCSPPGYAPRQTFWRMSRESTVLSSMRLLCPYFDGVRKPSTAAGQLWPREYQSWTVAESGGLSANAESALYGSRTRSSSCAAWFCGALAGPRRFGRRFPAAVGIRFALSEGSPVGRRSGWLNEPGLRRTEGETGDPRSEPGELARWACDRMFFVQNRIIRMPAIRRIEWSLSKKPPSAVVMPRISR